MNFERRKCNKMQMKLKNSFKIHLNNAIPTDRKILTRLINTTHELMLSSSINMVVTANRGRKPEGRKRIGSPILG